MPNGILVLWAWAGPSRREVHADQFRLLILLLLLVLATSTTYTHIPLPVTNKLVAIITALLSTHVIGTNIN